MKKANSAANKAYRLLAFMICFVLVTLIFPFVLASNLGVCIWEGVALSFRTMGMGYSHLIRNLTDADD